MESVDPVLHAQFTSYLKLSLWLNTVGIGDEFLKQFLAADDWSFVIKWHALLEVAATTYLTAHFEHPTLENAFSELPMGNHAFGKVIFLKACGLLSKSQFRFLQVLGDIRNDLAHDIRKISFSIDSYIAAMEENARKARRKEITYWMLEDANKAAVSVSDQLDFATKSPKLAIQNGCHLILYTLLSKLPDATLTASASDMAAFLLTPDSPAPDLSTPKES